MITLLLILHLETILIAIIIFNLLLWFIILLMIIIKLSFLFYNIKLIYWNNLEHHNFLKKKIQRIFQKIDLIERLFFYLNWEFTKIEQKYRIN